MNFIRVEKEVKKLHREFKSGRLPESDFRNHLFDMMIPDEKGQWWMVSYKTGQWHRYDGNKWLPELHPLRKSQLFKKTTWWVLGVSIILLIPTLGISGIGIICSIGTLLNQEWGRKGNIIFALLLELAGLVTTTVVVVSLAVSTYNIYDTMSISLATIAGVFSLSSGAILAPRLIKFSPIVKNETKNNKKNRTRKKAGTWYILSETWHILLNQPHGLWPIVKSTIEKYKEKIEKIERPPSGIWPIATPLLFTIFGSIPALGILFKKQWARFASIRVLNILIVASTIGSVICALTTKLIDYSTSLEKNIYSTNYLGIANIAVNTIVVIIWCSIAIRYLQQQHVKEWLNE